MLIRVTEGGAAPVAADPLLDGANAEPATSKRDDADHPLVSTVVVVLVLSVVILLAAALHRIAGLGFALMASPALVAFLGVSKGIVVVAITALGSSLMTLALAFRKFSVREVWGLLRLSALFAIPTVSVARILIPGVGEIIAGLCALCAVMLVRSTSPWVQAMSSNTLVAGISTGALIGLAGLGGPTSSAYAVERQWGASTIPNLQVVFLVGSAVTLAIRGGDATLDTIVLAVSLLAVLAGTLLGHVLRRGITAAQGVRLMLAIAAAGACADVVRGLLELT